MNMIVISMVESNLTIISAAYPSVRSFLNKVSTGFLVADAAKDSSRSDSHGVTYAMGPVSVGVGRNKSQSKQPMVNFKSWTEGKHTTTVRGDTESDKSFGSRAIMVRTSIEIGDAAHHTR